MKTVWLASCLTVTLTVLLAALVGFGRKPKEPEIEVLDRPIAQVKPNAIILKEAQFFRYGTLYGLRMSVHFTKGDYREQELRLWPDVPGLWITPQRFIITDPLATNKPVYFEPSVCDTQATNHFDIMWVLGPNPGGQTNGTRLYLTCPWAFGDEILATLTVPASIQKSKGF